MRCHRDCVPGGSDDSAVRLRAEAVEKGACSAAPLMVGGIARYSTLVLRNGTPWPGGSRNSADRVIDQQDRDCAYDRHNNTV